MDFINISHSPSARRGTLNKPKNAIRARLFNNYPQTGVFAQCRVIVRSQKGFRTDYALSQIFETISQKIKKKKHSHSHTVERNDVTVLMLMDSDCFFFFFSRSKCVRGRYSRGLLVGSVARVGI